MAGKPGRSGGQNRKRTEQRLGHANVAADDPTHHENVATPRAQDAAEQPELTFPPGHPEPLQLTQDLWASMAVSGFDELFTAADWQAARLLMIPLDQWVRNLADDGFWRSGQMAEIRSILQELMVTESARRRLRIEVQRAEGAQRPEPVADVSNAEAAKNLFAA